MIKRIGTDILAIKKLESILGQPDYLSDPFITKTFTSDEIKLAESRPAPIYCYATRFAGKEAVFKAISQTGEDVRLIDIEILDSETGRPYVVLHNTASQVTVEAEITNLQISLSYEDKYAIAYCIAE